MKLWRTKHGWKIHIRKFNFGSIYSSQGNITCNYSAHPDTHSSIYTLNNQIFLIYSLFNLVIFRLVKEGTATVYLWDQWNILILIGADSTQVYYLKINTDNTIFTVCRTNFSKTRIMWHRKCQMWQKSQKCLFFFIVTPLTSTHPGVNPSFVLVFFFINSKTTFFFFLLTSVFPLQTSCSCWEYTEQKRTGCARKLLCFFEDYQVRQKESRKRSRRGEG